MSRRRRIAQGTLVYTTDAQKHQLINRIQKYMLDNRNHVAVSLREKLQTLLLPSNFTKLVLIQQEELKGLAKKGSYNRPPEVSYIEQLYKHYITEGKGKTYLQEA